MLASSVSPSAALARQAGTGSRMWLTMGNDTDWLDFVDEPYEADRKAQRLVNALGKLPGDRGEKLRFLTQQMPLLEAEAGKLFDPEREPRKFGAAMLSLAFRYWRQHYRYNRNREHPQQQGTRSGMAELPKREGVPASSSDFLRGVKGGKG